MSRSRAPWLYRFVRDRRAQAEPLGVILVIGLVMVSTSVIVVFGAAAIDDVQSQSDLSRAENSMTLLDSRLSTVALSGSQTQRVDLPASSGGYSVDPSAGTIRIVHRNYSGTQDETILPPTSLGAITYRSGDASIAYQGGGVWRMYPDGSAKMVSPPEFHYRQGSLTFPLIRIEGSGNVSGGTTVVASSSDSERVVYPDDDTTYPDGTPYRNPIENGTVEVIIQSEYADAWGSYFSTRTDGNVTYPSANTVSVELVSIGALGNFRMPAEDQAISIGGMDSGHSLQDFSFTIRPQDTESSSFANLDWSMYAKQGQREFEIHVGADGTKDCGENVELAIYYSDDGGDTYHGWFSDTYLQTTCGDVDGNPADGDEIWVDVDLTPDGGQTLSFTSLQNSDTVEFKPDTLASDANFTQHGPDPGNTYTSGETEELALVTRHYFAEMGPSFDLTVADGNGAGVGESSSSGYIYYGGSGKVVTYVHLTEHNVTATVN